MDARFAQVAVIGTGMMGPGIALALAQGGCRVALFGRSPESVARGLAGVDAALASQVANDLITGDDALVLRRRVWSTDDLPTASRDAGLIVESIVEDLHVKQALFGRLEDLCGPDTLLVSDTSGLRISDIAANLQWPERTATMHYWNPPHLMPLVEITQGERTSESTVQALLTISRQCGKAPVVARRDIPGQIANRLQHALLREAMYMVQEGIASASDIDLALAMGPGRRWPVYGALEHQDMVGLDLSLAVQSSLVPSLCRADEPLPVLRELVRSGVLGVKAGQGFYDWSQRDADLVRKRRDAFLGLLAREERRQERGDT